jgi:ParB-like chromosome segregation protein Spo0J
MYDRMVHEHGYSIRKLADKLGKDKGYLENRLRLADAPQEVRALVSLRKDTLSHAYELMKVEDPKKRKRLADQVAAGQLTLIKLREKIEGRRTRPHDLPTEEVVDHEPVQVSGNGVHEDEEWEAPAAAIEITDDSLVNARHELAEAVDDLVGVLRSPEVIEALTETDRANLAKYLTINKLKLENVIAMVRSG